MTDTTDNMRHDPMPKAPFRVTVYEHRVVAPRHHNCETLQQAIARAIVLTGQPNIQRVEVSVILGAYARRGTDPHARRPTPQPPTAK